VAIECRVGREGSFWGLVVGMGFRVVAVQYIRGITWFFVRQLMPGLGSRVCFMVRHSHGEHGG
jgi:hypothetical protein